MDTFILMIFLAFVAWLVAFLPFVIVDTVLDTCFQVNNSHNHLNLSITSSLIPYLLIYQNSRAKAFCSKLFYEEMFQKPALHTIVYILNWTRVNEVEI